MQDFIYSINEKDYNVHIIHKRIKNIHYRFIDGQFVVSCHPLTLKKQIENGLNKFAVSLIERSVKVTPFTNEYIYLYGSKVLLKNGNGKISFTNGEIIEYKNENELKKKLKAMFLKIAANRTKYYANLMNLPEYKVSVRDMKTRYGSNSRRTQKICYSTILQHYSYEIIDSVIIHELAHIKVPNHSKSFYDVVYKYCPNYKQLRKKLINGEYA